MPETDAVAVPQGSAIAGTWSEEQKQILKNQFDSKMTDAELMFFGEVCNRTGFDPFLRQIYPIRYGGDLQIVIGIDGMRSKAAESGTYAGQTPPQWTDGSDCPACKGVCSVDGEICKACDGTGVRWKGVWTEKKQPEAARVGVYVTTHDKPVWGVAAFERFKPGKNPMWEKMGPEMIAKCAEAQALRKACPGKLSGLYSEEEMQQATVEPPPPPPTGRTKHTKAAKEEAAPDPEPPPVEEDVATEFSFDELRNQAVNALKAKGVTENQLETFLERPVEDMTEEQYQQLGALYQQLAAGTKTVEECFPA